MATNNNALLTKASLAASLAPPRGPPPGSKYRDILVGRKPTENPYIEALVEHHPNLRELLTFHYHHSPHPHLPVSTDEFTRFLGAILPTKTLHWFRNTGRFRALADGLVTYVAVPSAAVTQPRAVRRFLALTKTMEVISWGPQQYIQIHRPDPSRNRRRILYFMHGGAWGSGQPWMYRLLAGSFVDAGYTVVLLGYRVYPDGKVDEQVADCRQGLAVLREQRPELRSYGVTVSGHSSGAHIVLLWLVREGMAQGVDSFVGMSGPYNISHHFDYEAMRGVEELSPMKPVNGNTRASFLEHSPAVRLQLGEADGSYLPPMLLIHGADDETVPFTSTAEAAKVLRACGVQSCSEVYIPETAHQDVVVQCMMGGPAFEAILAWMDRLESDPNSLDQLPPLAGRSRL